MAVTVVSDNTTLNNCDSVTTPAWTGKTATLDTELYKQGTGSASFTIRTTGDNDWYFTVTSVNISNTTLRCWMLNTISKYLNTFALGGIQMTVGNATGTGRWKIAGSDTYDGGWLNICVDTARPFDSTTGTAAVQAALAAVTAGDASAHAAMSEVEARRARQLQSNRAVVSNDLSHVTIYADDGTTVLHEFNVTNNQLVRTPAGSPTP